MPPASNLDLTRLLVLREIETSGPLIGIDALNRIASTARLLGITPPGYALLHDLSEAGLLERVAGKPPLYRITQEGSREGERLAEQCWPRLSGETIRLRRRLAPASPRAWSEISMVRGLVHEPSELSR